MGIAAPLGAEDDSPLLRLADENDAFFGFEPTQVLGHHVVFALALDELHPRHPLVAGEPADRVAERVADLPEWSGRGDR